MSVKTDKDGFKAYHMKMDTGYLNTRGGDLNAQKGEVPNAKNLQLNFVQVATPNMNRIRISVPGFKDFGLKKITITEVKTNEVVFKGNGFTFLGMTRCRISRKATQRIITGEKYKVTISRI